MKEDKKDQVIVLIEQTGVETPVSRAYYEKYKNQGVRFVSEMPKKRTSTAKE